MPATYAVCTTARRMGQNLTQWAAYHSALGFKPLFVYLDDPDETHQCVLRPSAQPPTS